MAQTEDTELRDLVIEALEKNGSLAKVRALLRANIFLAFDEECENIKHNISLDKVLQIPEGILSLSLIHEFLEYCNLKNTMFVYVSETRQDRDYKYEGRKKLCDNISYIKNDITEEPLLVTIIKTICKLQKFAQSEETINPKHIRNVTKEEQNCTYIVQEDLSSATSQSQSQSDNSSDEKNKLLLRLPLDNSDTDTSSDSARDKTSSEYIPNENILIDGDSEDDIKKEIPSQIYYIDSKDISNIQNKSPEHNKNSLGNQKSNYKILNDLINSTYISSDSTSYLELPTNNIPKQNTIFNKKEIAEGVADVIAVQENVQSPIDSTQQLRRTTNSEIQSNISPSSIDNLNTPPLSIILSPKYNNSLKNISKNLNVGNSEITSDYSYDFSVSTNSPKNEHSAKSKDSPEKDSKDLEINSSSIIIDSPKQQSYSSQSSVSISDVADLIENSDLNSSIAQKLDSEPVSQPSKLYQHNKSDNKFSKDNSDEYSGSPIPSLSNLSLDFHSD